MFAQRIRQAREALKLNQEKFAEFLGYSRAQANRWEQGKAIPDDRELEKIATKLGVTTAWLRGLVDDRAATMTNDDLSPLEMLILATRQLRDASDTIQRAVNMLVETNGSK